jgi:hypothetical protein
MPDHPCITTERISANLQTACERVEAGFYFEEGGCFGMALALHGTFLQQGLAPRYAVNDSFVHAFVELDGRYFDYTGETAQPNPCRFLDAAAFTAFAQHHGHDDAGLYADQAYAQDAITLALTADRLH